MKESLLFPANIVHNYVPKSTRDHVCGCFAPPNGIARSADHNLFPANIVHDCVPKSTRDHV
eukprot:8864036-Heterocapsa_arctica.AAC.1